MQTIFKTWHHVSNGVPKSNYLARTLGERYKIFD